MQIVTSLLFFVLGAVIGSFLNVCIFRIPQKESIAYPSSHCMACGHTLGFLDLVPIFSWLFMGGKCRYCKRPISSQYIIIEIITGFLYAGSYLILGCGIHTILILAYFSILLIVLGIDLRHMYIPDEMVLLLLLIAGAELIVKVTEGNSFISYLYSAFLLSGILIIVSGIGYLLFHKEAMGMGDIKLVFPIGLLLGMRNGLMCLYLSFVFGAVVSALFLLFGKKKLGSKIPFGPYIVAAVVVVVLYGDRIWNTYMNYVFGV